MFCYRQRVTGRNYQIKVKEREEALANQTDQNKHCEGAQ